MTITPETHADIENAMTLGGVSAQHGAVLLEQFEAARARILKELPADVRYAVEKPWPSANVIRAVYQMTWHVVKTTGPSYFCTSDNPAFFFEAYGIGTANSELTLPLSSTTCLYGSRQGAEAGLEFRDQIPQTFVREANGRLAGTTERLAFYHEKVDWLPEILRKERPYRNAIRWVATSP